MFWSMLGSIFGRNNDYTQPKIRPHMRRAKYTEPFETDCQGFNTRFSLYEIECKVKWGRPLTESEQKFYDYIQTTQEES